MVKRVRAVVKATLQGEAEKKLARNSEFVPVDVTTFVGAGQFGLYRCIPQIPQASTARSRIGDWVHGQDLIVKVTIAWNPTPVILSGGFERMVRVALLRANKSPGEIGNGPGNNLLSVDGEVTSNWVGGAYSGAQLSHMPYSEIFRVIGSKDLLMTKTELALSNTPGTPLGAVYPNGGTKTVQFRVKNPGKFMFQDGSGQGQSVDAQNGGFYLHIVQYDPAGVAPPTRLDLYATVTSYLSYTDV